jgi:hypothetical protein
MSLEGKGTKREREEVGIDITYFKRDLWNKIAQYLNVQDVKNLSLVSQQMLYNMRHVMFMRFRFVVDDLDTFRTIYFFPFIQNICLQNLKDVKKLQRSDKFMDIIFPHFFNSGIMNIQWPERLTHLTFEGKFNQPVDKLPGSLTHLSFGYKFNQPVDRLPNSLTHLTFEGHFNQPVDRLPGFLTHLKFAWDFDQSVDRLPNSLTHLTFRGKFNQPVDKLPGSVTHLTFGYYFNQPVDNLPGSLTHLRLGWFFNQPVDRLPESLREVNIYAHQLQLFPERFRHLIKLMKE